MKRGLIWLSAAMTLLLSGCAKSASLGVIGGADGPTAIIVSEGGDGSAVLWLMAAVFVCAAAALIVRRRRNRRNGRK